MNLTKKDKCIEQGTLHILTNKTVVLYIFVIIATLKVQGFQDKEFNSTL